MFPSSMVIPSTSCTITVRSSQTWIYLYPKLYINLKIELIPSELNATLGLTMARKEKVHLRGTWIVKDVPRELMHRMKVAAAVQKKTLKQLLFELSETHLEELERKGILPKSK